MGHPFAGGLMTDIRRKNMQISEQHTVHVRSDGRRADALRPVSIKRHYLSHPQGSVLISMGQTKVICTAMVEEKVPPFLKGSGTGWVTAEYGMLPGSTNTRKHRDSSKGKVDGRSQEIQRLIGRSLRSVVDLAALGERTIWIDCDVIQADGGTRTASITGAFVALTDAISKLRRQGLVKTDPIKDDLAAVSVGILSDGPALDLCYIEDSNAIADVNVVMTGSGQFIEVQGTGEERPFSREEFNQLLEFAEKGIKELITFQKEALRDTEMVLASSNKHKLEEIMAITEDFGISLKTLDEVGLGGIDIVEDGATFEENALIKARTVAKFTGRPTVADDSGLAVDHLDGAPGVYSARFAGEPKSDAANNKKLLDALEGLPTEKRAARFVSVIALVWPDGRELTVRGEVEGIIGFEAKGSSGFGYDPLFIVPESGMTFAELSGVEKNRISHRANALSKLKVRLPEFI